MKKKIASLFVAPLMLSIMTGFTVSCGKPKSSLTLWTFTNELKKLCDDYYTPATGKKINVVIKDSVVSVVNDLMDLWDEGLDIPDVIALESAVVKDPDIQEYLTDLSAIEGTENMYQYTKGVATNADNELVALSWQATPGGFFYKRRVAQAIGVNEAQMATYLSSWGGFMDLAKKCKEHNIAVVSSITEPMKVFLSQRQNSWVKDNVLQLEEVLFGGETDYNCFDVTRSLHIDGYTHQTNERSSMWYADVDSDDCLGYFASCWGLNFDLMERSTKKEGWAMCKAPYDYFKGGTWLAIPSKTKHLEDAKDFIKYITTNENFLENRCRATGDFMNNKIVMNKIIEDYSCPFLDGQNHFKLLVDVADKINGNLISPYDSFIDSAFQSVLGEFASSTNSSNPKRPVMPKREDYKSDEEYNQAVEKYNQDMIQYALKVEDWRDTQDSDFRVKVKRKYSGIDVSSYVR